MAVPGVGGDFAGPVSHRGDPRKPYLPVDTLAGAAKFRLQEMVEAVQSQGRVFLMQLCQFALKCLVAPFPPTGFAICPAIVAAA